MCVYIYYPDGHDLVSSDCEQTQHTLSAPSSSSSTFSSVSSFSDIHHSYRSNEKQSFDEEIEQQQQQQHQQVKFSGGGHTAEVAINSHNSSTNLPTYRTSINISGNSTIRSNVLNKAAEAVQTSTSTSRLPASTRFSLQVVEFNDEDIDKSTTTKTVVSKSPPPIPARRSTLSSVSNGLNSRTLSSATSAPVLRSMFSKARQATTVSRSSDVSRNNVEVLFVLCLFLNLSFLRSSAIKSLRRLWSAINDDKEELATN